MRDMAHNTRFSVGQHLGFGGAPSTPRTGSLDAVRADVEHSIRPNAAFGASSRQHGGRVEKGHLPMTPSSSCVGSKALRL